MSEKTGEADFLRVGQSVQVSLTASDTNTGGSNNLKGQIQEVSAEGLFFHHESGAFLFVPWTAVVTVKKLSP
jgi:hypothetical protein